MFHVYLRLISRRATYCRYQRWISRAARMAEMSEGTCWTFPFHLHSAHMISVFSVQGSPMAAFMGRGRGWKCRWSYAEVIKPSYFQMWRRENIFTWNWDADCKREEVQDTAVTGGHCNKRRHICTVLVIATPVSHFWSGRFDFPRPHPMIMWESGKSDQWGVSTSVITKVVTLAVIINISWNNQI